MGESEKGGWVLLVSCPLARIAIKEWPVYHDSPFTRFAKWTSRAAGHPTTFVVAVLIILVWAVTGPIIGFSDTWQLVINTSTTINYVPDGVPDPEHSK